MTLKTFLDCEAKKLKKMQSFLLPHRFKTMGIWLSAFFFIALFVNAFTINNLDFRFFIKSGLLISMLLIAISKESVEDERIAAMRMQSFAFAFIAGVTLAVFQPYVNFLVDYWRDAEQAIMKDTGDFEILWILLSVKVFFFEYLKRLS